MYYHIPSFQMREEGRIVIIESNFGGLYAGYSLCWRHDGMVVSKLCSLYIKQEYKFFNTRQLIMGFGCPPLFDVVPFHVQDHVIIRTICYSPCNFFSLTTSVKEGSSEPTRILYYQKISIADFMYYRRYILVSSRLRWLVWCMTSTCASTWFFSRGNSILDMAWIEKANVQPSS